MMHHRNSLAPINGAHGTTILETVLAMALALIVLAGVISIFTVQDRLIRIENDSTKVRAKGRHAIKLIAREVRMAGHGLSPDQTISGFAQAADSSITAVNPADAVPATAGALRFRVGRSDARTFLDYSSTELIAGSTLPVIDGSAFQSGDHIAVYNPGDENTWDEPPGTITAASSGQLTLSSALLHNYPKDPAALAIMVAKFIEVTLKLDGGNRRILKTFDAQESILASDVALAASRGLEFDFHGASTAAAVERIGIVLNLVDPKNPYAAIEFKTDVQLRNSGN